MAFPNDLTTYYQASADKISFTLAQSLTASTGDTTVYISGSVDAFIIPCIINVGDELMEATAKDNGANTLTVTRAFGNTSIAAHNSGDIVYLPLTAEHFNESVDGLANIRKFFARLLSSAPSSPEKDEIYINSTDNLVYWYNGSAWEVIGFYSSSPSHEDLRDLDSGDPHTYYYTESRLTTNHDDDANITGDHVTDGDSHDHLEGVGFGRMSVDTTRLSSAPTYDGEIVLNTSTGELYFSYIVSTPDVGDWNKVIGAPSGLVAPFDPANLSSSCPTGWSRYTGADGRFVKGVTGSTTQTTGGSQTHNHTYESTNIINHSHTVDSQSITMTSSGHQHSINDGSGSNKDGIYLNDGGSGNSSTTSSGGHGHTATISTNTDSTGVASPTTDSANGEPPYEAVIWCQKD